MEYLEVRRRFCSDSFVSICGKVKKTCVCLTVPYVFPLKIIISINRVVKEIWNIDLILILMNEKSGTGERKI